ncbi:hypothetical protein IKG33_00600 [Candidatus Saccharibacteria bacterium]|nr:hypothetical protein [Candidatus Saccharibacteria bacterium]
MDTSDLKSTFRVPSFERQKAYDFDEATKDSRTIYEELNAIAEEIEKCRLRNC